MSTVDGMRLHPDPARVRMRPRRRLGRRGEILIGAVTVVALLLVWELAAVTGLLPPRVMPSASAVGAELGRQLIAPTFWVALWETLYVSLLGLLIAFVIAVPLSVAMGRVWFVRESVWVLFEFLKPIPAVALLPLTLLIWGPSLDMKLFLVVFAALWPLQMQMTYGVREVGGTAMAMARSYRLGWWLTTTRIVVPSLLPFAATGLRISASIALIVAIVTEMVGGVPGLGQAITLAQIAGLLAVMYALIVATGLLGLVLNGAFRLLDRVVLFWHPSQRGGDGL